MKLKWVIPAIALALAALGIGLAVERRKTPLRMAIGVALLTMVLLAGLSLGRITFLNHAGQSVNRDVAAAVWDTMLRFLKTDLRWTLLISVLVALGAWLAGPARYAVWIRSTVAKGGRWVAAQWHALTSGAGRAAAGSDRARRTGGWITEHLNGLRIVGVVVAALFLVFGGNLTGWSLLIIVIVLAVYLGLLQLVAAWARKVANPVAGSARAERTSARPPPARPWGVGWNPSSGARGNRAPMDAGEPESGASGDKGHGHGRGTRDGGRGGGVDPIAGGTKAASSPHRADHARVHLGSSTPRCSSSRACSAPAWST